MARSSVGWVIHPPFQKGIELNPIDAISFDADQTLFDFQRVMNEALEAVAEIFNQSGVFTSARVLKETRDSIASQYIGQAIDMLELRRLSFAKVAKADEALVEDAMAVFRDIRFGSVYFYPSVKTTLAKLSENFKLGLITNGNSDPKRAGIDHYFSHIILGEKYSYKKPDPRIFSQLLSSAGISDPNAGIHVGDSLTTDVKGANEVGMRSVWFNPDRVENRSEIRPHYTISLMSDLLDIVGALGK